MSDTDEHEFHIEGETLQTEAISHPQSSEDDETKCKLQQALDNKLLKDAGFPADEMDEAERREILWALRESMPDTDHKNPAASVSSNSKVQRKEVKPEEEFLPEDPLQKVVDTTDDDVGQACDSTTSAAPSRSTKARTSRKKQQPDASALSETELTSVLHTRRSRRPQKKLTDGGSDTSEKSEDGDGLGEDLKTRSLKKLTAKQREMMKLSPRQKEQCQSRFKDLLNKTTLSLSQQGTSSQGSHLSPVKEGIQERDEADQASQDLFGVQQSDEEEPLEIQPTPPVEQIQSDNSASSPAGAVDKPASQKSKPVKRNHEEKKKKTRTPSPVEIQSEDSSSINEMGGGTQEFVVQDQRLQPEELETQSLEDYVVLRVEEGEEEEEEEVVMVTNGDLAKEKLADRRSSPVYSVQVTKSSCSSPQPSKNDRQIEGISPSKLPIEDEDENDNRPLLHDNWFSWPHVPPACHLQRSYRNSSRKRKEPPTGTSSYLCPKSVSPEQHSKVILQMLDTYLLRFTRMQCRFKKLAWGKPVHTGLHLPGTLDMRKRGGPTFCFNLDEDDDFENGQPPSKKLAAGDDVQRKRNLGLFRNKQGSTRVVVVTREEKVRDDPGSAGVSAEAQSVYDAETQPMESDDELPDIQLSTKTAEKGRSRSRNSEDKCIIPGSQGSQSSNSLLNEQGELYSTQVPHRKRRVEAGNEGLNLKEERRKRVCKTLQESQRNVQSEDDDSNLEVPPLTRKRKQVSPPSDAENQVEVLNDDDDDDDDDEVSFPQKKKIHVGEGFIHISSSGSIHKNTTHQTVVRPRPQRGNGSGNATGLHMRNLYSSGDSHFNPFRPSTSSKEHGKPGQVRPNLEEESDDSVQFVDPSSLKQTEERRIHVQPQSVQVGEATKFRDDIIGIASTSRSQSAEEAVQEEEEGAAEQDLVECPLCSKPFPCSLIQQHASDCTGEEEPEVQQKLPEIERKAAVYSALQLKRRPLRGEINRDEFTCALCNMKLGGSSALMRHFEKCRQQHEKAEACGFSGDMLVQRKIGIDATKTRSAESAWMHSYKIPRKEKDGVKRKSLEVQLAPEEEMDEVIQQYSDDSDKDPDFALTKDDKRQEREDVKEDDAMNEENGASTNTFIPISHPKTQRRRATKGKDKE